MVLVPFERVKMHSPHNGDVVLQSLEDSIEPTQFFRAWSRNHKPYQGKVEGDSFSARRIIHYRNSFLPQIRGRIERSFPGCTVTITMFPQPLFLAFMVAWIALVAYAAASPILLYFLGGAQPADSAPFPITMFLIPASMVIFGYVITLIGFKVESSKSKTFFRRLFEADKVEDATLQEILWAA